MADRTCPSCGADVSSGTAAFCPRCGADLHTNLIELGGPSVPGTRRTPRKPRPKQARLLAGVAAVLVGGLAVSTLVGDDGDGGEGSDDPDDGEVAVATTTTLADLGDRAPLLGEEAGIAVAIRGQANVLVDLDTGEVIDLTPSFQPTGASDDGFVEAGDLGVQLWRSPYDPAAVSSLDDRGAETALLGDSVAWAVGGGEARGLRLDAPGELVTVPIPANAEPVGVLGDSLVIGAPGGTFVVAVDGTARISGASPLHAEHGSVLAATCDEALTCVVLTLDRSGQVLSTMPIGAAGSVVTGAVGPAGQVAWVGADSYVYVDGRRRFPLPSSGTAAVDWSPDGRWLVGSFGRSNLWFLDAEGGPAAEPQVVELDRNVYPSAFFVVEG